MVVGLVLGRERGAGALGATQRLLADVLGTLMAGQEWGAAQAEFGHAPRRTELEFGLRAKTSPSIGGKPADQGDTSPS